MTAAADTADAGLEQQAARLLAEAHCDLGSGHQMSSDGLATLLGPQSNPSDSYGAHVISDFPRAPDQWVLALENFGEALVAHLLDLMPGQRPTTEDIRRWEIVSALAAPIDEDRLAPEQRVSWRCQFLCRTLPKSGLTYFEFVRAQVGGRSPSKTGDNLVDAFVRLVFNGLAMEHVSGAEWDRFAVSASFQDPVLCNPAAAAFLDDPDLTALFPGAQREPDERGRISATALLTWLPADGGTTSLGILIGNFVEQTLARMRFMDALAEDYVEAFVRESLEQVRRFARGEDVEVLVLTGLLGIDVEVPLDRGTWGIRTAQGLAVTDLPPFGERRPKSVLWTKVRHRLLNCDRADVDEEQIKSMFGVLAEQAKSFHAGLDRRTMTVRFGALAWAVDRQEPSVVNVLATASWSLMPISSSQHPWVLSPTVPTSAAVLTEADLAVVGDVVEEIGEVSPRLDIALSRMVRVASERRDPVDALVDAVIAWENMLGSTTETTFKVCAALSWLLEPDDEARRRALFSKAKKIYDLRSRLVHGSADTDPGQAADYGQGALNMAVRAFRRIHADPSLIDIKSSSRTEQILLRSR